MQNTPVSIIVPCYNQAQYLDECLESVLNQTYSNWECIIVNDGSPDNTDRVAEKWCKKDSRFKYFKKTNGGLSSARNYGINRSFGEFILPLDSDDKIGPDFIKLAIPIFNNSKNIKVIHCKTCFFGEKTGLFDLPDYSLKKLALVNILVCTALYKKIDWKRIGGYDENIKYGREDWEFWLNLLKDGGYAYKIDSIQFFYRIKTKSMDTDLNANKEMMKKTIDYITAKHAVFYFGLFGNPIENYNILNDTLNKYESIRKSRAYRIGSFFLFFPKLLRHLAYKIFVTLMLGKK
jgi:glycosyltransferase involved in cell wall biosynthesis